MAYTKSADGITKKGKTVVSIVNGNIAIDEDYLETVGRLNAAE